MSSTLTLVVALALYVMAHLIRLARIAVLSLEDRTTLRRLITIHLILMWPITLLPFKSGEVLRLLGFAIFSRSSVDGISIWAVERYTDAIALILGVLTFVALTTVDADTYRFLIVLGLLLIVATVGGIAIRQVIPYLNNDLLLRSRSRRGLTALVWTQSLQTVISRIERLLKGRFALVQAMSLVIWALEIMAVAVFFYPDIALLDIGSDFFGFIVQDHSPTLKFQAIVLIVFSASGLMAAIWQLKSRITRDVF